MRAPRGRFFARGALRIAAPAMLICLFCQQGRADVFRMPQGLTRLETVPIGDPGNADDETGYGGVSYPFVIGKYEVTAAQYAEFLNAVARENDPHDLRNNNTEEAAGCGIVRTGVKGSYVYQVAPEFANRPANHVSFWDACRFANWLHNGQGNGDTETGAYTLRGYKGADGHKIQRNRGARWFVPSEDEWYKAAYYDPQKPGGAGYWDYPTRSDSAPGGDRSGTNSANGFFAGKYLDPKYFILEAGSFPSAGSGYDTLDQAGNVFEWNEAVPGPLMRGLRGGGYVTSDVGRNVRVDNPGWIGAQGENPYVGFRIAGAATRSEGQVAEAAPAGGADGLAAEPSDELPAMPVMPTFARRPWRHPQTGRPFFPMGWYAWESDAADLEQLAREGANTILYVGSPTDLDKDESQLHANLAAMIKFLDDAGRNDIKVIMQCGWYEAFRENDRAYLDRIRRFVETVGKHPALLAYQLFDEPEYKVENGFNEEELRRAEIFIDSLTKTREGIRRWDSNRNHCVQVVFNLVPLSSYTSFFPAIDGFQIDRYPIWAGSGFMAHNGDWGPLTMAWSISHGASAVAAQGRLNPVPVLQGIGLSHDEARDGSGYWWRNPTYEETRYMAHSSLTCGGWGFLHWIRNASCPDIKRNVARLHAEFRQLIPALESSYETPPFSVDHPHTQLTRNYLTDRIPDITTLALEDETNYYLIAADNSGNFDDVTFRMRLPNIQDPAEPRRGSVLNEDWSRPLTYDPSTQEWQIPKHAMCFGDVNIWVIPKRR